jgi:peptidyl-prolyl cis-trans isomerase SurA
MEKIKIVVFALFIFAAQACYAQSDRILVKVNDAVVLQSEVDEAVDMMATQLKQAGKPVDDAKLRKDVLESLVQQKLIITMAKDEAIVVSDEAVTDKVNEFLNNLRSKFKTEDEFEAALGKEGMSYNDFRLKLEAQIRDSLIFNKVKQKKQQEFISKAPVADSEIEKYYNDNKDDFKVDDEVSISQVLLSRGEYKEDAKKKADEISSRLKAGEDFSKIGDSLAGQAGITAADLGWVDTTQLDTQIREALKNPKKNKVVSVDTAGAIHVIRINDFKKGKLQDLSDIKEKVRVKIIETKVDSMWEDWIKSVKNTAFIKYVE